MVKILFIKENELYGLLMMWFLFNIFLYNHEAFVAIIFSISLSEAVLIFIDYVAVYTKRYLALISYEDNQE